MSTQIRRNEINLEILGSAMILFGIWTIIKYAVLSPVYNETLSMYLAEDTLRDLNIILWGWIAIEILFRCCIGFSARAEGKGKSCRRLYLILAAIIFVLSAASVLLEIIAFASYGDSLVETVITVIIDATSAALVLEVLIYGCRLRRLKKNSNEEDKIA